MRLATTEHLQLPKPSVVQAPYNSYRRIWLKEERAEMMVLLASGIQASEYARFNEDHPHSFDEGHPHTTAGNCVPQLGVMGFIGDPSTGEPPRPPDPRWAAMGFTGPQAVPVENFRASAMLFCRTYFLSPNYNQNLSDLLNRRLPSTRSKGKFSGGA